MILERPAEGEFRFPVVAGIAESLPRDSRELRMGSYVRFMKDIELAQPGADDHVSEVDISDAADLRATITGLGPAPGNLSPILVHFGASDFGNRYHLLSQNIGQWRASAGSVDSVDLRFARQVVVNPETRAVAANLAQNVPEHFKAAHKRQ
jgi:cell division protein FtsQ